MRFGTDGVRGVANAEVTPEFALALGHAAARVLGGGRFLIGRDTRRSGPMLESALAAGLCSEGCSVELLGVLPTPAVACLSALDGVAGAVISASHNAYGDNGIKLFAPGGLKLGDDVQIAIEAELARVDPTTVPVGASVGTVTHVEGRATERYESAILDALEGRGLDGLHIVIDCANGAAWSVAPDVMGRTGATVSVLHAGPDGTNINEGCGSTAPDDVVRTVLRSGADLGFTFDGDADRVLAVDHRGRVVDGDQLIAVAALDLRDRGLLEDDTVVVTVMTNLGFRQGMAAAGIRVVETAVGDRSVLEALDREGASLGGEQSGHVIFRDRATTGDGLLTALVVADVVRRRGRPLADLVDAAMIRLPQVLRNVRLPTRPDDLMVRIDAAVRASEAALGETGRILIRPSGTEPLVRVMVEAPSEVQAAEVADRLVAAVESAAG